MAKKQAEKSWADKFENAMRTAVSAIPGSKTIPEREWCEALSEALDAYKTGIDCRLQELDSDDDE